MEGPANQVVKNDFKNLSLELLQNKLEYLEIKGSFFEKQTIPINKLIHEMELENQESLKEQQEMTEKLEKGAEMKNILIYNLMDLKIEHKSGKPFVHYRVNGFYECPDCLFKHKKIYHMKEHIAAVHLKLKFWKCSNCAKSKNFTNKFRYFD